jgi:ribonuclease BN (tRNA processing enzyme)
MRLTTIGTGAAAPTPYRVCAGHLVEAGATRLLLDCGSGVVHRMAQLGIGWMEITHLALTHFHADHTSDVATLVFGWR